ncbi:MAG: chemotaxis protein CheW, partial [Thiothrix sp.]|nr:chemotaxis protein CheW [Thiothrix sp.]
MPQSAFYYPVGKYRIVIEPGTASEVLSQTVVYPVPFAPDWCAGLVNVRGDIFPVLDMHHVLLGEAKVRRVFRYLLWLQHEAMAPVVVGCDDLPRQLEQTASRDNVQEGTGQDMPVWVERVW